MCSVTVLGLLRGVTWLEQHCQNTVAGVLSICLGLNSKVILDIFHTDGRQEINEERTVEILAELIHHKPITKLAFENVGADVFKLAGFLQISVQPQIQQLEPQPRTSSNKTND